MKRKYKLLIIILTVIVSTFALTSNKIISIYNDKITLSIKHLFEKNIKTEVTINSINTTIFKSFPYISVKINNLTIYEDSSFNYDTLIYAQEAKISVRLFNIFTKKNDINQLHLKEGQINIRFNEQPNYLVYNSNINTDEKKSIVKKIKLTNIDFRFIKEKTNLYWYCKNTVITPEKNVFKLQNDFFSTNLNIGSIDYLKSKNCFLKTKVKISSDSINIYDADIKVEKMNINARGYILKSGFLSLNVKSTSQKLDEVISQLPTNIKNLCTPFIATGIINYNAIIKGNTKNSNPKLNMDFNIVDGTFLLKKNPFQMNKIKLNGTVTNGTKNNLKSTKIDVSSFEAQPENSKIIGSFIIENLNKMYLKTSLKCDWDLSVLNNYFKDSPFLNLSGNMKTNTNYSGEFSFNSLFKKYFLKAKNHLTHTKLNNVDFNYLNSDLYYSIINSTVNINKSKTSILNSDIIISDNKFSYEGEIQNLIENLLNKSKMIEVSGVINSPTVNLNKLKSKSKNKSESTFPEFIKFDLTTNIAELKYKNFTAKNIFSDIKYKNNSIEVTNLSAEGLDGKIYSDFTIKEPTKNYLVLNSQIDFDNINIRRAFKEFNNFNQQFIKENEINGVGTVELDVEAHWKPGMIFDNTKLKINSHLVIEEGELIDFKPLENLSTFISLDDLKHVKFSTLENTINVENQTITVPAMEIKSSALSLFISGKHSFNQNIDYKIKLLLSELLFNSFRKKNTSVVSEFGEFKAEIENLSTIYLTMKGNTENPKIAFDGLRFKEELQNTISTEIKTISDIIKEDVLKSKDSKKEINNDEIIIEWEEINKDVPKY